MTAGVSAEAYWRQEVQELNCMYKIHGTCGEIDMLVFIRESQIHAGMSYIQKLYQRRKCGGITFSVYSKFHKAVVVTAMDR